MESAALFSNRRKRRNKSAETNTRSTHSTKPQEPGYELPIERETQSQTRDRNIRNQEKKIQWDNQCAQLDNLGPTVDRIPWEEADIKVRSYIYLSLGNEGQRRLSQHFPDLKIPETSTRDFGIE